MLTAITKRTPASMGNSMESQSLDAI